jgi:glycosyltransferase involved in cell wall biosynthesis/SAM-dependent methyltransferase
MTRTVVHYIDTPEFGGAEQAVLNLLSSVDRQRFRPILFHPDEEGLQPLISGAASLGIETRIAPRMRGLRGALPIPLFRRMVRAEEPAVFHAHLNWPLGCSAGILGAASAGVPAIVASAQLMSQLPGDATIQVQRRVVTRVVDRYVAVSQHVADELQTTLRIPPQRISVVHNAVVASRGATPASAALRATMSKGTARPVVLTLARLTAQKGLPVLLRAAAELPDVAFAIAGVGPDRAALETLAQQLGIADRVSFLGFRSDTAALLASADVFVLPSLSEGLPLSVLEAMSAGRPVIATAIGGTDEVLTDGETGLLVESGNSRALAAAVRRLLDDPALAAQLAMAGRVRVAQSFSADRMARQIERIYDELALSPDETRPVPQERKDAIRFGDLRRVTPISREFGFDRGSPIDRRYIEAFLDRHRADIQGRVLEVKDASYTRQYGGDRVAVSEVLDIDASNQKATLVDDLTSGETLPSNAFDCVVLTQTLHLIFDVHAAARTLHRILKPGGVLLLTVPGITQIPRAEAESWYWSFSARAAERLFRVAFSDGTVEVESHGNVLAATSFLYGLATRELLEPELDAADPDYPVTITVRAVKSRGVE